jgi:hypothetical protein
MNALNRSSRPDCRFAASEGMHRATAVYSSIRIGRGVGQQMTDLNSCVISTRSELPKS